MRHICHCGSVYNSDKLFNRHLKRGIQKFTVYAQTVDVRPVEASRLLSRSRAKETLLKDPLFLDPYAGKLAGTGPPSLNIDDAVTTATNVIATAFIDQCLMNAVNVTSLNRIQTGDYHQVVLLGDPMDTRPYRLPWPTGTVLYVVGSAEVHEVAEAVMAEAHARMPRGCMIRRVSTDLKGSSGFQTALERAGFRADRLSLWGLQGSVTLGLDATVEAQLLLQLSELAAYHSLVVGHLHVANQLEAENMLASVGLMAATTKLGTENADFGRWQPEWDVESKGLLFTAQQQRPSCSQIDTYRDHAELAEQLDEDFNGNFS